MEHAMTKFRGAHKALPVSVGAGPASTWVRGIAETAWSFLWRVRSARDAAPTLMEWDNDGSQLLLHQNSTSPPILALLMDANVIVGIREAA
jgi:hypothetical protein